MHARRLLLCLILLPTTLMASEQDLLHIHKLTAHEHIFSDPTKSGVNVESQLLAEGFSITEKNAAILHLSEKPFWTQTTLYKRPGEFSDDYTILQMPADSLAFTGAIKKWKLGKDVKRAKILSRTTDSSTTYSLHNTQFSVHYKARSNCNDSSTEYPIETELTLEINQKTYPLAKGYYDDIATNMNNKGEEITCAEFIANVQSSQQYAAITFIGDLNGDTMIDAIVKHTEKYCHITSLYLGHQEKEAFVLEHVSSDDVCGS